MGVQRKFSFLNNKTDLPQKIHPFVNYIVRRLRMEIKVNKILSPSDGLRKGMMKESFSELHQNSLGISSGCGEL